MRRLLPILLLSPLCVLAAPPAIDPPPPMPPAQATSSADEPEVRIIEQKNATITEYRSNGRLYKIKVQPKIGPAYYLIDKEGKGHFDRGDNPALENMPVPQWVLFEF